MSLILKAEGVSKYYGKSRVAALNHISFDVKAGEFVSIMGASGSGKTTLLNVLSTIDNPTEGKIVINGVRLQNLRESEAADFRKNNLGFIFQEYFLLNSLTVKENIAVPLALKKLPPDKIDREIKILAKRFGIDGQLNKYPSELSGGQRQRVAAARAIIKRPSILFADEPTGALDSASATELLKTLQDSNEELGTTILMVTHDAYAASFSKRILIFKDGNILCEHQRGNSDRREFYELITKEVALLDDNR